MYSLPRWLISITDMPVPRQSQHLGGGLRKHAFGQRRGAGAEIEHSHRNQSANGSPAQRNDEF
jgi:hypothetical protein